jgi:hypothetical protein
VYLERIEIMNVAVRIDYLTTNKNLITQQGSFPARGRKPEEVAYDFWGQIKRDMRYDCQLDKVTADSEVITEKVKK